MSDLEKFLQQAAQRMKERQAGGTPPRPQPPPAQPARPQQPRKNPRPQNQPPMAEIVDAEVVTSNRRELGPDRLSTIDTRPTPGTNDVNQADERMASHVQQVFDHGVGQLSQQAVIKVPEPTASSQANDQSNRKTEVQTQQMELHWLSETFRNPNTLRAAFIASEIFRRKF